MQNLIVKQAAVDYYGFFVAPAFNLMGEMRQIIGGLSKTFAAHNVGLGSFRLDGDISDPSTAAVTVRLGPFGLYKFKFDQVQASLGGFTDDELEGFVSVIGKGNQWVRDTVESFTFKTHVFSYASHSTVADGTSSSLLLGLPRRPISVPGQDLGSGILETWHDPEMNARVRLMLDHSLQEPDGLYLNFMVVFERDVIDYVGSAHQSRKLMDSYLANLDLAFAEDSLES